MITVTTSAHGRIALTDLIRLTAQNLNYVRYQVHAAALQGTGASKDMLM